MANGIPVYEYFFTKDNKRLAYNHGGEEVYFYNNIPAGDNHYDQSDRDLMDIMSNYFANYLRSGDPNGKDLPAWPKQTDAETVLELGDSIGTVRDPFYDLDQILQEMGR